MYIPYSQKQNPEETTKILIYIFGIFLPCEIASSALTFSFFSFFNFFSTSDCNETKSTVDWTFDTEEDCLGGALYKVGLAETTAGWAITGCE